jgi:hypothetical protein
MLHSKNPPNLTAKHISEVSKGLLIANLGEVLEVEEHEQCFMLIISRMNEKQVIKFEKDIFLITL